MAAPSNDEPQTKKQPSLRASCDSCRRRKLKCSGETGGCAKCLRDNIECVYTPRASLGRPRKLFEGAEVNEERPRKRSKTAAHGVVASPPASHENPDAALDFQPNGMAVPVPYSHPIQGNEMAVPLPYNHPVHAMETQASQHIEPNVEQLGYLDQMLAIDPMLENLGTGMNLASHPVYPVHPVEFNNAMVAASYASQHPQHPQLSEHPSLRHDIADTSNAPAPILASPPPQAPPSYPCDCAANHDLIASRLHSVSASKPTYDAISERLPILRSCLYTAETMLNCPQPPNPPNSDSHHIMLLLRSLRDLALAYRTLLDDVPETSDRILEAYMALHDNPGLDGPANSVPHPDRNSDPDAVRHVQADMWPRGIDIYSCGSAWSDGVLASIRRDIFRSNPRAGTGIRDLLESAYDRDLIHQYTPPVPPQATLESLVSAVEARQRQRQATMTPVVAEQAQGQHDQDDAACLEMIKHIRGLVSGLKWDQGEQEALKKMEDEIIELAKSTKRSKRK